MNRFEREVIRHYILATLLVLLVTPLLAAAQVDLPSQSDWQDQGVVLSRGSGGSWDWWLVGELSPVVLKKDGKYFMYYIGADGRRSSDSGPRFRALGVATSTDGVNFTKYDENPIVTYRPHNNEEEGIFSVAASLDDNGEVVLYYGALRSSNSTSTTVDVDIRITVSADGLNFTDDTLIYRESGEELTPIGAYHTSAGWHLYFVDTSGWRLRVLSGSRRDSLGNPQNVISSGARVNGGGDPVFVDTNTIALFVARSAGSGNLPIVVEARTASANSPEDLSAPITTYDFAAQRSAAENYFSPNVMLDNSSNLWRMYVINHKGGYSPEGSEFRLLTANLSSSSDEPPPAVVGPPPNLTIR